MKLVAGHGAEVSGRPGRDAWMPPRFEDGLRDGRAAGRGARRPRAIRGTDASPGSSSG